MQQNPQYNPHNLPLCTNPDCLKQCRKLNIEDIQQRMFKLTTVQLSDHTQYVMRKVKKNIIFPTPFYKLISKQDGKSTYWEAQQFLDGSFRWTFEEFTPVHRIKLLLEFLLTQRSSKDRKYCPSILIIFDKPLGGDWQVAISNQDRIMIQLKQVVCQLIDQPKIKLKSSNIRTKLLIHSSEPGKGVLYSSNADNIIHMRFMSSEDIPSDESESSNDGLEINSHIPPLLPPSQRIMKRKSKRMKKKIKKQQEMKAISRKQPLAKTKKIRNQKKLKRRFYQSKLRSGKRI